MIKCCYSTNTDILNNENIFLAYMLYVYNFSQYFVYKIGYKYRMKNIVVLYLIVCYFHIEIYKMTPVYYNIIL